MVDARSEPEYEPRAHTTTRRLMVTLAARRFSKVRPYSYADARLETRHAQLVPDLPLRLYGAWLTRGPGQNFNPPAPGTPSFMLLAAARAMGRPTRSGAPRSVDSSKGPRPRAWSAASSTSARAPARSRLRTHRSTAPPRRRSTPSPGPSPRSWPRNIRVKAINPGIVETEGLHTAGFAASEFRKQVEAQTPFGRIGQPHDIAPAAVFLASAEAAWITGETLLISGGLR